MDTGASAQRRARRTHSDTFKAQILQACNEPGASISGTAIAHGLNPNLVQRWRRQARCGELALPEASAFVPVTVASTPAAVRHQSKQEAAPPTIEIHLQRGALQARAIWPIQAADACAAWLRELFR